MVVEVNENVREDVGSYSQEVEGLNMPSVSSDSPRGLQNIR